ncbi:ABC transporter permease [Streptomyces sp. NPDC057611]|uniref:ABC transporter permease n=1 Tax=Streptomyces sp. NPDC057611 TaxID=3346182 RepID=UPI0036C24074
MTSGADAARVGERRRGSRFEKRSDVPLGVQIAVPILAVAGGLAFGAVTLILGGHSVSAAYGAMWDASFGTVDGFEQTLIRAMPLILTGLAVTIALRMNVWNVGAEGQMALGAIGASFVAFQFGGLSRFWLLVAMFLGGCVAAGVWALIAAVPRAVIGLNEIITTLFLNYIGLLLLSALVNGPWKDPTVSGFAYSKPLPADAALPFIGSSDVTIGLLIAVAVVVLAWWFLDRTRTGFSLDIAGGNLRAARYLGMGVRRRIVVVMVLAAAVAGIAGVIQLLTSSGRLQDGLTGGYGYTGILVTFLARRRVAPTVMVAILFAGLLAGAAALQSTGIPSSIAQVVQAVIIIFVLAGEVLSGYRLRSRSAAAPVALTGGPLSVPAGGA